MSEQRRAMSVAAAVPPAPSSAAPEVAYPERDGRPMGESDAHRDEMKDWAIDVLAAHFAGDPMVYVSGNNFLYYARGVPARCVSPDAYVVKGVAKRLRPVYKTWEERGKVPCFVLEVTSSSTRDEDLGVKMRKYRDELRVPEYVLFDLTGDWIPAKLRGYRLRRGAYVPMRPRANGRLFSRTLGLELAEQGGHLRFFRPGARDPLPTDQERAARANARAARANARAARADARAARAQADAREERERARDARQRAERAERELVRLRARLGKKPAARAKRGGAGARPRARRP